MDQTRINALLANSGLSAEKQAEIEKALKANRSRRIEASDLEKKYSHMVKGSLGFDEVAEKQTAKIVCTHPGCENQRTVFTSDLFQVKVCEDHKKAQRAAARKSRAEEGKKALALLRSLEAEQAAKS